MAEFTKLKIGFALALLGTLFALHTLLDRTPDLGFVYLGYRLEVIHAYALTSGLLGLCVYLYAVTLLNDHPHSRAIAWRKSKLDIGLRRFGTPNLPFFRHIGFSSPCQQTTCGRNRPDPHSRFERAGNATYSLAILVLPVYGGLFLSATLAERVALSHLAWAAPAVAVGLGSGWVILSQVVAWRIGRRLGERDRASRIEQLAKREAESLAQANEFLGGDHYDLCVVEAWRALESRLRQALLTRRISTRADDPQAVIRVANRKGLLKEPTLGLVAELKRHWSVAVSTEPLDREAAIESLGAVRYILSILPAKEPLPTHPSVKSSERASDLVHVS